MIRVQFNDSNSMITAEFALLTSEMMQLTGGKVKADTSGFKVYRLNGSFLGDYSEYTKIVKEEEGCVQFGR